MEDQDCEYQIDKISGTVESTDQAPQAAVASTPKNNQTRRNPEQKHVKKSFDPYTIIARDVIQNILGKKEDLKNYPCHVSLHHAIHVKKRPLEWNQWTLGAKKLLVEELFNLHADRVGKTENQVFPKRSFSKALRIEMNHLYPEVFGYGLIFNAKKSGAALYSKCKSRVGPKHEAYLDEVFWSIQETVTMKATMLRKQLHVPKALKTASRFPAQRSTEGINVEELKGLVINQLRI